VNLPLMGVMMQWVQSLVGDVLRWSAEQFENEDNTPVVGIPVDEAEGLIATLETVMSDLDALVDVIKGNKGGKQAKSKVDEIVKRAKKRLVEVCEVIDDFSIEDTFEDDEDFVLEAEPPEEKESLFEDDSDIPENQGDPDLDIEE